jgi:6-phosphogluconolactonase (cycloisomerase 2 family)
MKLAKIVLAVASLAWVLGLAGCSTKGCSTAVSGSTGGTGGTGSGSSTTSGTCTITGTGSTSSIYAYAVDQAGTVDSYALNTSANTLASTGVTGPTIAANGGGVGMVVAQGQYVYVVLQIVQQIYGFSISSTGTLTALNGFPIPLSAIGGIPADGFAQNSVITNPAGTLLFISSATDEQIAVYQIGSDGSLTAANGSPFAIPGFQPQNLAMDGLGRFLYASENSSTHAGTAAVAFSVGTGTSSGALTIVGTYSAPIFEMRGDPSGNFLVGISGDTVSQGYADDDNLYVYSINQTTGALTVPGTKFTTTHAPYNIAMQPTSTNGEFVYSFSLNASGAPNAVEAYQMDPTTGALSAVQGSPFTSLQSAVWGQFDQSGSYLFYYFGTSPANLGVFNVATTGGLSQPVTPVALATTGYWAVSDTP